MDATDTATPGWYGKLSSLGDFASRRLPPEWIGKCDPWLSREMRHAEQKLGERWLSVYLTAPVLRFAWAPGVIDAQWWFGVLMPSCDKVGRYFPLVIAHGRMTPPEDAASLQHLDHWYAHVSAAALATLDDRARTPDEFDAELARAPAWPRVSNGTPYRFDSDPQGTHYLFHGAERMTHWLQLLASRELAQRWNGCTLWWSVGSAGETEAMDVLPGLPADLARMLEMAGG